MGPGSASITFDSLVAELTARELLSEEKLISLLGERRHHREMGPLEIALVRQNVVDASTLLTIKQALSGRPVLDDARISATPALPVEVARDTGSLVLNVTGGLVVAMVEDTPANLEMVATAIGTRAFTVVLMLATQFLDLFGEAYGTGRRDTRPEAPDIFELVDEAVRSSATDIHLSVGEPPVLRISGQLNRMAFQPLSAPYLHRMAERLAGDRSEEVLTEWEQRYDADFAISHGTHRLRVNIGADDRGMTVAARLLPTKIRSLDELSAPRILKKLTSTERGLILVTGPTGSGKSTTMAAFLQEINSTQSRHIVTLEQPVEYYLPQGRCLVHQRQMGTSFTNFPDGLRQALRQDPDIIFVGEMRDVETIKTALMAAETGHLVVGTMHLTEVAAAIERVLSSFDPSEQSAVRSQLSFTLRAVIGQVLVPRANGRGVVACHEVLVNNDAVANNLRREGGVATIRQVLQTSVAEGMQTMDMALVSRVREQIISETEAEKYARDLDDFHKRLARDSDAS